jgi:hypothetical protein
MTIYLSLLVALIGVVVYAVMEGKPSEIGRVCFWTGLLAFLLQAAPHTVSAIR